MELNNIVVEINKYICILKDAMKFEYDLDGMVLEDINSLIDKYIDHSDYIVSEQAIILENIFNKYNSVEYN